MKIAQDITVASLEKKALRVFEVSAAKVETLDRRWNPASGSPVYTVQGQYTSRGWTEWTQGFQFGSAVLQFDATGERGVSRDRPRDERSDVMAPHVTTSACTIMASTTSAPMATCCA